ncbi:MAG: hypothetical protein A2939_00550 [Parcubacteria group bacterium RIFCSPLOWO2_01_FULL_48_18]|nr:MAG: hypothetical protein A2939_00550 [Parcubacteria group bacterium RIFCSPLOWO2_01_FULL_48_18]
MASLKEQFKRVNWFSVLISLLIGYTVIGGTLISFYFNTIAQMQSLKEQLDHVRAYINRLEKLQIISEQLKLLDQNEETSPMEESGNLPTKNLTQ